MVTELVILNCGWTKYSSESFQHAQNQYLSLQLKENNCYFFYCLGAKIGECRTNQDMTFQTKKRLLDYSYLVN